MAYISVTAALGQAGIQLLNKLIEFAQERGGETDDAVFTIIEHWAREVMHVTNMPAIFNAAQDEFADASGASTCWLEAFSALFEHGGEAIPAFAENLWRAYFLRLEDAPDALWSQYPDLQRTVTLNTERTLPRSWGEWVLPIEDLMSIAEARLNASTESFEHLVISQDAVELLTDLASTEAPSPQKPEMPDGPAMPPDAATTLVAYLTACTSVIGQIDPRGLPQVGRASISLENVFLPLRLVPFAAYAKPVQAVRYQTATFVSADLFAFKEPLDPGELETHPGLMPQDVLSRHPQVLILGEVGSGKTTLLRAIAFEYARGLLEKRTDSVQVEERPDGSLRIKLARPLPIYVNLSEYGLFCISPRYRRFQILQGYKTCFLRLMTQQKSVPPKRILSAKSLKPSFSGVYAKKACLLGPDAVQVACPILRGWGHYTRADTAAACEEESETRHERPEKDQGTTDRRTG